MSLDFMDSLEDIIQMIAWDNRKIFTDVGKVRVNERNMSYPSSYGICTEIRYNKPFHYQGKDYERIIINSFIVTENIARTIVWGLPPKTQSRYQNILASFSNTYKPFEMPKIHESTLKEIEKLHLTLHANNHYSPEKKVSQPV